MEPEQRDWYPCGTQAAWERWRAKLALLALDARRSERAPDDPFEDSEGVYVRPCDCDNGSIETKRHTADPDALEPAWILEPCPRCRGRGEILDWRRPWWL